MDHFFRLISFKYAIYFYAIELKLSDVCEQKWSKSGFIRKGNKQRMKQKLNCITFAKIRDILKNLIFSEEIDP